jgi:hypothetical protein
MAANFKAPRTELTPDYVFEWLIPERVLRFKRRIPSHGQSTELGEYLAAEYRKRKQWALAMVSQIREEREHGEQISGQ